MCPKEPMIFKESWLPFSISECFRELDLSVVQYFNTSLKSKPNAIDAPDVLDALAKLHYHKKGKG